MSYKSRFFNKKKAEKLAKDDDCFVLTDEPVFVVRGGGESYPGQL